MIYAAVPDMLTRFGAQELAQLTDDAVPPTTPDESKIRTALADASSEVDSYLSRRYALPIAGCADPEGGTAPVPPPVLTRVVCDLARNNLLTNLTDEHDATRRRNDVVKLLESIAAGRVSIGCPLGDVPAREIAATTSGETVAEFSPRQIADDDLRGY
jgi:phage gp36-like protein